MAPRKYTVRRTLGINNARPPTYCRVNAQQQAYSLYHHSAQIRQRFPWVVFGLHVYTLHLLIRRPIIMYVAGRWGGGKNVHHTQRFLLNVPNTPPRLWDTSSCELCVTDTALFAVRFLCGCYCRFWVYFSPTRMCMYVWHILRLFVPVHLYYVLTKQTMEHRTKETWGFCGDVLNSWNVLK